MMAKWLPLLVSLLCLQGCSRQAESVVPAVSQAAKVDWIKPDGANVDAIFAQAQASNKPVFLYWGAVWCPPCNQVKATVFNRQDFIERSKLVIPVYLDGDTPGAQKLGAMFKVKGYPTMIVFKPDRTELTRLPGEVDAQSYIEALSLASSSGIAVKDTLATALGKDSVALSSQAWRQLAYYSWDQDASQLVSAKDKVVTLDRLALSCPPELRGMSGRLTLKAIVASTQENTPLPDPAGSLNRALTLLNDANWSRESFDVLVNYGTEIANALTAINSAERSALVKKLNVRFDQFAQDKTLSEVDRLTAIGAKVSLQKLGLPPNAPFAPAPDLVSQVRSGVSAADAAAVNQYERQAIVPGAADLLAEVGLLDESDAMLKSELSKALSPYYHMLVLSANAKKRGDIRTSLDWSERSWRESQGPATRLQWGVGHLTRLIEMTPDDADTIVSVSKGILAELEAKPETFYERNLRNLGKLALKLNAWNGTGKRKAAVNGLAGQLHAKCALLPKTDETRAACYGVFKSATAKSAA